MRRTRKKSIDETRERLNERIRALEQAQSWVPTGNRTKASSSDVGGVSVAIRLQSEIAARIQEVRNVADGMDWVTVSASELQGVASRLRRARELAVRNAGLTDEKERAALQAEVVGLRDQVVAAANTMNREQPVFAGFAAGEPVARVAGTWTYQGDAGRITRCGFETDEITVNVIGDEVFGFADGQDVFTLLDDLSAALDRGDQAAIDSFLAGIDASVTRVGDALSVLGSAAERLEVAYQRSRAALATVRSHLSEIEEVDTAEAISELQMQEVVYKATLSAMSRTLQPSLVEFLE